ncbi:MAG TPA: family 20 glycosylhydrolase, partial [Chitinophagaceae bacterium]|nr:family 20 glycosylhydrolase [Chitinophagaceae bacterium]
MKKSVLSIILSGLVGLLQAQPISIIPQPAKIIQPRIAGKVLLSSETPVVLKGKGLENSWNFLHDYVKEYYGIELKRSHAAKNGKAIYLGYEKMNYPVKGAYRMQVKADGVHINGDNENGVFYGVQTLLQLLPAEKDKPFALPFVNIEDYPRFAYRGLHLDVGRHFFGVDFIKKYIDYIALHKLNYFHWHLTEDQGWRIEIKRYPELTKKGAWRNGT